MKNHVLLIASAMLMFLTASAPHKFYVGICSIEHNQNSKSLEITLKLFRDDLELALTKVYGNQVKIEVEGAGEDVDVQIEEYVRKGFSVEYEGTPMSMSFIGYEAEDDMVWMYVEVDIADKSSFEIDHTLLFELFEEQTHIVHFRQGNDLRSTSINRLDHKVDFSLE